MLNPIGPVVMIAGMLMAMAGTAQAEIPNAGTQAETVVTAPGPGVSCPGGWQNDGRGSCTLIPQDESPGNGGIADGGGCGTCGGGGGGDDGGGEVVKPPPTRIADCFNNVLGTAAAGVGCALATSTSVPSGGLTTVGMWITCGATATGIVVSGNTCLDWFRGN